MDMQLLILIQGADLQHFFRSLFRVRDHIMLYHTSHSVCNFHACFHSRCNISYTSSEFNADKERYRQAVSIGWFVFIKNLQADICCLTSGIACYKAVANPNTSKIPTASAISFLLYCQAYYLLLLFTPFSAILFAEYYR